MWMLCIATLLVATLFFAAWQLSPPAVSRAGPQTSTSIASAAPSATDIVRRMGLEANLVARSSYDDAPELADLPVAGNALGIDWERLAQVRPNLLLIGTDERLLTDSDRRAAEELDITIVPAAVRRLADVTEVISRIAKAAGVGDPSASFSSELEAFAPVGEPLDRPRILVALDPEVSFVAGRDNYIDDLIRHVGGENAVSDDYTSWPTLDQEALLSLRPDVVVVLLPDASPQVIAAAEERLARLAQIGGAAWEEATIATGSLVMTPGWTGTLSLAAELSVSVGRTER
ncbi:MAG: helical backbone metal receptor [Planctomycetota bacterium]